VPKHQQERLGPVSLVRSVEALIRWGSGVAVLRSGLVGFVASVPLSCSHQLRSRLQTHHLIPSLELALLWFVDRASWEE
jgi:hypothetical protein